MNPDSKVVAHRSEPLNTSGAGGVSLAFKRALVSQLHPRMLFALFLPFIIALLGAIVLLLAFWTPLTAWLTDQVTGWGFLNTIDQWMLGIGLFSLNLIIVPMLAVGILLPLAGILGLSIAAIFVMPLVLRHLEQREYKGLARRGEMATAVGLWNAIWVGGLFAAGWLLTMPLWLFPPLPILLSVFWWTFAFTRMLRVDAVVEHASAQERRLIWKRHNRQYWLIGFIIALVNLFPPAWLVLPVFSALVFAHYSLEALRQLRSETVIDV